MIFRYGVVCPGCSAKIILRVGVGADDREPFFYVCAKCHTPTKVVQNLIYEPSPHTRLELEAGEQFDPVGASTDFQVITIHPEMPSIPSAGEIWHKGGSPFLHQHGLLEGKLGDVMQRTRDFRGLIDKDWNTFKRFSRFYVLKDWDRFDDHGKKLLPTEWPGMKTENHRHDFFHVLLQMIFQPILIAPLLLKCKMDFTNTLASQPLTSETKAFCSASIKNGVVKQLQHDVLERLDFVAQNKTAMLSVLPLEFYGSGSDAAIAELRLFRDEFTLLKTHYIDSYELAHKVLSLLIGLSNCLLRGNPNAFDPLVMDEFSKKNMKAFASLKNIQGLQKLPNAPKRPFLNFLPEWGLIWDELLNSKLRNSIGHHSARHDLASGQITIDGGDPIPYLRFAFETFRLTHLHVVLLHVLKMMQMIPNFKG